MAGHSKWSQIKRQKGANDKKRGAIFTKLGNTITLAAKEGGGDLDSNFKLRLAVDKAKAANMPKDNIERAIKRGTGELEGGQLFELTYETFGPAGVGVIISVLSDNKNRSAAEIKHTLSKQNTSLGAPGSVSWQFKERGVIRFASEDLLERSVTAEEATLHAIEAGADDVVSDEGGVVVYTAKEDFQAVVEQLRQHNLESEHAEIELVPENTVDISEADAEKLERLLGALDELDDVSNCYHNANI